MKKWSVVACDQYTSEPEYWNKLQNYVMDSESTLNLIIPEIYLNSPDIDTRTKKANSYMTKYVETGVFKEYKNSYIFVERTLRNGVKRLGIVGSVDLEDYDYSVGSKSKIRATEGTVVSRIPPRLKVRCDALIELPHIMMLIDDEACDIVEYNSTIKDTFEKLYDFDLFDNSGHLTGYRMSEAASDMLDKKLSRLDDIKLFNDKYGVNEESALVFAMGDGNHSLATAKAHYENLKKEIGEENAKNSPARYALCELVNLHDSSLVFEAIHRVVFNCDGKKFLEEFSNEFNVCVDSNEQGQTFRFVFDGKIKKVTVTNPKEYLTIATVQNFLDNYVAEVEGAETDYIHGEEVVKKLCENKANFGIIFDAMDKADLYKSVILDGALPRKTFSMGEACDKRFYTEARKIR
ncbi:MAG: DUF1015 domain-containing protein [Clostridia bacterium]|nr:DUF1015 domain-containing protein [Clostridia bacterium]